MPEAYPDRQYVVNRAKRPARSAAGDAFTDLVLEVAWLGGLFTAAGESLARVANQTLARWVVLDAVVDQPATVARVARRRRIARQAVQRVADLLVRDGLAIYEPNPSDRRAQLLNPTDAGCEAIAVISTVQKSWADKLGAEFGKERLARLAAEIAEIRRGVSATPLPGPTARKRRTASI